MSRPQYLEIPLPEFEEMDVADRELIAETLAHTHSRAVFEALETELTEATSDFELVPECIEDPSVSFRQPNWHVDSSNMGMSLSIFASSTPATFASMRLGIEEGKFRGQLEAMPNSYLASRATTNTSDDDFLLTFLDVCDTLFGRFWLDTLYEDQKQSEVRNAGVIIEDLVIIQADPFEVATGVIGKMVHRSSLLQNNEPLTRVFGRRFH